MNLSQLTLDQQRRYARHIVMEAFGEQAQTKLLNASALVIGAGGLGAASLSYLAAAGIGKLGIMDHDSVERSNLNRQIIFETGDIRRRKTEAAADRISEINPDTQIEPHHTKLSHDNADKLISQYDIILDGCDNFETRFIAAAATQKHKKPLISAAVRGFEGQISTFKPYLGSPHPCYRCLVPQAPSGRNNCKEGGVIGPLVGILGSMQALEAIKEIANVGESLSGTLLRYNALTATWNRSKLLRDPHCPFCSN